jgi:hypothetical protein
MLFKELTQQASMKNKRAHYRVAVRIIMDTNTLLAVDHDLTNFENQFPAQWAANSGLTWAIFLFSGGQST